MDNPVLQFIVALVAKKGRLPEGADLPAFNFVDSGHIDSLAIIKFVLDIEMRFDIALSEEDMLDPRFRTIGGLAAIVESKLAAKRA